VNWLSDAVLAHLCKLGNEPELSGTRYELIEKIGQGGMGSVYLVRDRVLDRQLALKVLNPGRTHQTPPQLLRGP